MLELSQILEESQNFQNNENQDNKMIKPLKRIGLKEGQKLSLERVINGDQILNNTKLGD